jgi:F0F1-type ATP synthase alpha subunit
VPSPRVRDFDAQFIRHLEANYPPILRQIAKSKDLDDKTAKELEKAVNEFRRTFLA